MAACPKVDQCDDGHCPQRDSRRERRRPAQNGGGREGKRMEMWRGLKSNREREIEREASLLGPWVVETFPKSAKVILEF